ncbi:ImmA/IrrE family metallo-endopeptidase [Candidatus Riflebacteria bacterium]
MARSHKALINPILLKWARDKAGYSVADVAKKMGKAEDIILKWESGAKSPTISQTRKLADIYKRPLAVFFLSEVPMDFSVLKDFRRLPLGMEPSFSPELRLLMRQAQNHQEWVEDYYAAKKYRKLKFIGSASINIPSLSLAEKIRKVLGIPLNFYKTLPSKPDALRIWIEKIEQAGIFVFQSGKVAPTEARGFAVSSQRAPFIFLNSKDPASARIFTLLHEVVHIWINETGVSNLMPVFAGQRQVDKIEVFCNKTAGEILVPSKLLKDIWLPEEAKHNFKQHLSTVADLFKVSREVIARRLLTSKFINQEKYLEIREFLIKEWDTIQKKRKSAPGGPPYARMVILNNGKSFSSLVLSTYINGEITGRDISDLLNVNLKNIPKIVSELGIPDLSSGLTA